MSTLDWILGFGEAAAVAISLGLLVAAAITGGRWITRAALILAALTAITVAQPVGIKAVAVRGSLPAGAAADPDAVHEARLLGIPLVAFALYPRRVLVSGENGAPATERVRSWLRLPILTNASTLSDVCGKSITDSCPTNDERAGPRADRLLLRQVDSTWYAALTSSVVGVPGHARYAITRTWKLVPAVTSPSGLAYWVVALALALVAIFARRSRGHAS